MSQRYFFFAVLALFQSAVVCKGVEKEVWEEVDHNVRIMRHRDGTNTEYYRSNDEKTLVKKRQGTRGGRNSILTTTVYRMDAKGNPLSCKIFDGKEHLLYKVRYGYHRKTGRLVAEDMFDARVPQINPQTGKEVPVRRMYWFYDGAGNVTKAFSFVWRKGNYAEEEFNNHKEIESNFPSDNPFRNKSVAGTPAAPKSSEPFKAEEEEDFAVPPPLPPLPFEK